MFGKPKGSASGLVAYYLNRISDGISRLEAFNRQMAPTFADNDQFLRIKAEVLHDLGQLEVNLANQMTNHDRERLKGLNNRFIKLKDSLV